MGKITDHKKPTLKFMFRYNVALRILAICLFEFLSHALSLFHISLMHTAHSFLYRTSFILLLNLAYDYVFLILSIYICLQLFTICAFYTAHCTKIVFISLAHFIYTVLDLHFTWESLRLVLLNVQYIHFYLYNIRDFQVNNNIIYIHILVSIK